MTATFNVLGLLANLIGVVLLFRYGMPYRTPHKGSFLKLTGDPDSDIERRKDRLYAKLGFLGLTLIVAGTGLQIVASVKG